VHATVVSESFFLTACCQCGCGFLGFGGYVHAFVVCFHQDDDRGQEQRLAMERSMALLARSVAGGGSGVWLI
jgi:hypothetical protein